LIRDTWKRNTLEPKPNEPLKVYLQRHCHRDESHKASERFASEFDCTIGLSKKQKTTKANTKTARLEAIKWGGLEVLWNELAHCQGIITGASLQSSKVDEQFACVCSLDKSNIGKRSRCILKQQVADGLWDTCDETGETILEQVRDTDENGPVKEWGLWYMQPTMDNIANDKRKAVQKKSQQQATTMTWSNDEEVFDELGDFIDGFQLLDADAEQEEIKGIAMHASIDNADDNRDITYYKNALKHTNVAVDGVIRVLRELGIGTTITVCKDMVRCNCEQFNKWKICRHCIYFEYLHCGSLPQGIATDGNQSYLRMRETILGHINNINI
jgi:hypothetical protein